MTELLIIGAGPAGLTAAIYARRAGKSVLVLEKDTFGGQITYSPKVENYPGFTQISGNALAQQMLEQAMALGADIDMDTVTAVAHSADGFTVTGERGAFTARSVIIAAGAGHRRLHLPGEEQWIGNGISFCAVCDGAFYQGADVVVVGGGNTALQEILLLSEQCKRVTVVQNLAFLTGEDSMIRALRERKNIEYLFSTVVTAYEGDKILRAVQVKNTETGASSRLTPDGLFLAIGTEPHNEPYTAVAEVDAQGYLVSDESCRTKTPGLFVAGDCRTKTYRQVATAVSDGASAALSACRWLDGNN